MVIVQINYRRPDMPQAEWNARYTDETAKPFLSVDGLQWKIWLDDEKDQRSGGIYCFADRVTAQAYVDGPIVARIKAAGLADAAIACSTCAPAEKSPMRRAGAASRMAAE